MFSVQELLEAPETVLEVPDFNPLLVQVGLVRHDLSPRNSLKLLRLSSRFLILTLSLCR